VFGGSSSLPGPSGSEREPRKGAYLLDFEAGVSSRPLDFVHGRNYTSGVSMPWLSPGFRLWPSASGRIEQRAAGGRHREAHTAWRGRKEARNAEKTSRKRRRTGFLRYFPRGRNWTNQGDTWADEGVKGDRMLLWRQFRRHLPLLSAH
jgi:hypothetical protein